MLWHGQICTNSFFCKHKMAAHLATDTPASPLESFSHIFARDVRQLAHGVPSTSNDMHNFCCMALCITRWVTGSFWEVNPTRNVSRKRLLDCDHKLCLIVWQRLSGFPILCPEPRRDRLFDIRECFLLGLPLGIAAGKSRALGYEIADLILFQDYVKHHKKNSGAMKRTYTFIPHPDSEIREVCAARLSFRMNWAPSHLN